MNKTVILYNSEINSTNHSALLLAFDHLQPICGRFAVTLIKESVLRLLEDPSGLSSAIHLEKHVTPYLHSFELPTLLSMAQDQNPHAISNLTSTVNQAKLLLKSIHYARLEGERNRRRNENLQTKDQ